jgi:hypothetical protein
VPVDVPELVLAVGVPSDQALMSSRMSETEMSFESNVRGTVIDSDLRWEVDSGGLCDATSATGEGRVRGEGSSEGSAEARRVMVCGNVGSSCGFGTDVFGISRRGLPVRLQPDGWSVPELAPRGIGRRESGRGRLFDGVWGEERETN